MAEQGTAITRRAAVASVLMGSTYALSHALVPTKRMADMRGPFKLEELVPKEFGDWRILPTNTGVINPQTQALLKQIYTQTLSRTYVNGAGEVIMLSIAYGADQADEGNHLHYPEVCYPAQGFQLKSAKQEVTDIGGKAVPIKRLMTELGTVRSEPVTYWMVYGDHLTQGSWAGWSRKLSEIRHGLKGEIPDGTLVRMSNISDRPAKSFELHDRFARDMVAALSAQGKLLLLGL